MAPRQDPLLWTLHLRLSPRGYYSTNSGRLSEPRLPSEETGRKQSQSVLESTEGSGTRHRKEKRIHRDVSSQRKERQRTRDTSHLLKERQLERSMQSRRRERPGQRSSKRQRSIRLWGRNFFRVGRHRIYSMKAVQIITIPSREDILTGTRKSVQLMLDQRHRRRVRRREARLSCARGRFFAPDLKGFLD